MIKRSLNSLLRRFGYKLQKVPPPARPMPGSRKPPPFPPPEQEPVWPLPRKPGGPSDDQIGREFARHDQWHYAYRFEGGLSFSTHHSKPTALSDAPDRPVQRFRHFMPYVIASQGGSLKGKRVLDIACNSGFWSIQCALLGAKVTAFDARPELIEQAELIKSIVGIDNVEFRVLDFWDMSPALLGTFDVVLCLGILYHLPKPLQALELVATMAERHILLDTQLATSPEPVMKLYWEQSDDVRTASNAGIVVHPTKSAVEMMLQHIAVPEWFEIPVRSSDMPPDYLDNRRAAWLIAAADAAGRSGPAT